MNKLTKTEHASGNYIPVNSYTERDRGMMERVIRAEMAAV